MAETPDNSSGEQVRIEPASINLTARSGDTTAAGPARSKFTRSPLVWVGIGALVTSMLVVVFLLPRWVSNTPAEREKLADSDPAPATAPSPVQKPAKDKISPWEKARESSLRKETQDILSQMLEAQKGLADRGVELWAGEAYAKAMQLARQGDEYYNERDFVKSKDVYAEALAIFTRLVEEMETVFENTMEKGHRALVDGDSRVAKEAFALALAIDAMDRAASDGMERAEKLDEVLAIMARGDEQLGNDELEAARDSYQAALDLDQYHEPAKKGIDLVEKRIIDRDFAKHMSAGFSALEAKRFNRAREAFTSASKLKPGSAEARSALEQTANKLTTIKISTLLKQAGELEEAENWHEALARYQSALELDSSLAEAREGRDYASLRSKLHDRLEEILSQPKRLYDEQVYMETRRFQEKLQALSSPGPILSKQLAALDTLLERANTPVEIVLRSDNQTQVTLRKVGDLGMFQEKTLTVKPGEHVLVGIRDGYRDVRVEFFADPEKSLPPIVVQAAEKIALGR